MKRRLAMGIGILALTALVSACSGGSDIKSIDELKNAYQNAGFACSSPTFEQEDSYEMYGCENGAMLTFIKNKEGQKRHEDSSETMGSINPLYVLSDGDWRISSFDRSILATDLGGEVKTYE
ncbi:hypothetical protein [Glutamicibacter sp. TV12E]|uniref:hypothetical protein n=1 Tax=Glutamicibacter sp. TV12E TaxID=3446362 RepID=UPI004034EA1C